MRNDDFFDDDNKPIEARELSQPVEEDDYDFSGQDDFDDAILAIDYSALQGDFNSSFGRIKHTIKRKRPRKKRPLSKTFYVKEKGTADIGGGKNQIERVVIPRERKVIIEGVEDFIMSTDAQAQSAKDIGYYQGKKLKELILSIDNTDGEDFEFELFNPSMPLDFLHSSSANLNDRIKVGGLSRVSYTDMLFNILANPTLIPNARFVVTGPKVDEQKAERLTFVNKAIDGEATLKPMPLSLNFDIYQFQNDIITFDIMGNLNRAFIPNGMDIIQYKVLAGNTVKFVFFYKQESLIKLLIPEANITKTVLGEPVGIL